MRENPIRDKSFAFALQVVELCKYLQQEKREYVLCKQLLRSGTAVGALVREAEHAESKADFIHKMAIAQKEANETDYWLELLYRSEYIAQSEYRSLAESIKELQKMLTAIIVTAKKRLTG